MIFLNLFLNVDDEHEKKKLVFDDGVDEMMMKLLLIARDQSIQTFYLGQNCILIFTY